MEELDTTGDLGGMDDLDLDEAGLDLDGADFGDVDHGDTDMPDPFGGEDMPLGEVHFGSTVGFEDGTQVTNPQTDALGYAYKDHEDWVAGANKNVVDEGTGEAHPATP